MDIIYTYGGGEIIWKVFNGIAIMLQADSPYVTNVVYLSALIGTIWAAARALPAGQIGVFTKSWFIPTYVILSLLLVPKTNVKIVDEVDPSFRGEIIKGVPVGIAFVASVSSSFSRALTDEIEKIFAPELKKHGSSVPVFAAKLMSEARYVRIADPTVRKNIKNFCRQCYRLPFVHTNIKGLRNEALSTNDMLGFVQQHAHPWLGIYWEDSAGQFQFMTCKEAIPHIKTALNIEGEKSLFSLLSSITGRSLEANDIHGQTNTLKAMSRDVWQRIAKQTSSASKALEQQLMVNSYREARDDKKSEFGMDRISPELLSYSKTRVLAQQNTGFLLKASIAGSYMPMLQSVAFALLLMVGIVLVPVSLMPGGALTLIEWVKMLVSVQLWPVFSAIINSICYMAQEKASHTVLAGAEGFSISTQTGLADAAFDVASWMGAMQLSLPFLSWAFVSRSGIAVSQLMSSFSSGLEGGASKIGAETADGNITFDTQSFRNQSMGNIQYAQQQFAANTNHGSTMDNGKIAITNSVHGQQTAMVKQDVLTTAMSSNDNISAQAGKSYSDSMALAQNQTNSLSSSVADRGSKTASLIDTTAKGHLTGTDLSQSETSDLQKRAEETQSLMEQYGQQHGLSTQSISEMAMRFNTGNTAWGKIVSGTTGLEGQGGMTATANNQEQLNKFKNSDIGQRIAENVGFITSYASQHKASITDSAGQQAAEGYSASYENVRSAAEQLQNTYTRAENWANVKSMAESQAFSSTTNENEAWISYVADRTGQDVSGAVSMIEAGGADIASYRSDFIDQRTAAMSEMVEGADHVLSQQEIANHMGGFSSHVSDAHTTALHQKIGDSGMQSSASIQSGFDEMNSVVSDKNSGAISKYGKSQNVIEKTRRDQRDIHREEDEQLNAKRMWNKYSGDLRSSWSGREK